jgi:hypothetical protein
MNLGGGVYDFSTTQHAANADECAVQLRTPALATRSFIRRHPSGYAACATFVSATGIRGISTRPAKYVRLSSSVEAMRFAPVSRSTCVLSSVSAGGPHRPTKIRTSGNAARSLSTRKRVLDDGLADRRGTRPRTLGFARAPAAPRPAGAPAGGAVSRTTEGRKGAPTPICVAAEAKQASHAQCHLGVHTPATAPGSGVCAIRGRMIPASEHCLSDSNPASVEESAAAEQQHHEDDDDQSGRVHVLSRVCGERGLASSERS